jgi:hypothetical protein
VRAAPYADAGAERRAVANAKLAGLLPDIGVKDASAYNTALALYFVRAPHIILCRCAADGRQLGYILFEIPANLMCVPSQNMKGAR